MLLEEEYLYFQKFKSVTGQYLYQIYMSYPLSIDPSAKATLSWQEPLSNGFLDIE